MARRKKTWLEKRSPKQKELLWELALEKLKRKIATAVKRAG